jgi:uncharacterized protein YkwD
MKFLKYICSICIFVVIITDILSANDMNSPINKKLLLKLVNDARRSGFRCGSEYMPSVPMLVWNDDLERAAAVHSLDMMSNDFFDHIGSDNSTPSMRLDRVGYKWSACAENIAQGQASEQEVVAGWLKSTGHCKNIMGRDYTEMGAAKSGNIWVQVFGKRRDF